MQVSLPHKLHHCACLLPKQPGISITNVLQALTLKHKVIFIAWLAYAYVTKWANPL